MQRYFVKAEQITDSHCYIKDEDAHHIANVIRLKAGDDLVVSDGQGRTVMASIEELNKLVVTCRIIKQQEATAELPVQVTIIQALPKADKFDMIVQKGTELGATQFVPFSSLRAVVKYDTQKAKKKQERWVKIAKEAAEQAHRDRIPQINSIHSLKDLLHLEADVKLVAYEQLANSATELTTDQTAVRDSFIEALRMLSEGGHVAIVIGPEGGLDSSEVEQLILAGYHPISLGRRIMRTETASAYVLSAISFYFDQLGGAF